MKIYFAAHATTVDNENDIASGWQDCELSELGKQQAAGLGKHFAEMRIDLICGSDLKRSSDTIAIAFGTRLPIVLDQRLREINYGDYNGAPKEIVDRIKVEHLEKPFPHGESYQQAVERVQDCLNELIEKKSAQTILIVGHRATHYAIEILKNDQELDKLVAEKFIWQPHWLYEI